MSARSFKFILALLAIALLLSFGVPVRAKEGGVSRFATLPPGPGHPEGIAADAAGNTYAATFEFPPAPNKIHAFGPNGKLKFSISIDFSPLGMIIGSDGGLWVTDFGNGRAVKFSPPFSSSSTPSRVISVCGGAGGGCALNAFDFDGSGNLFVSDSFGGRIFKIALPTEAQSRRGSPTRGCSREVTPSRPSARMGSRSTPTRASSSSRTPATIGSSS